MTQDTIKMRKVIVKGITYVRVEDIVEYIKRMSETEEIDTKNRLMTACYNIEALLRWNNEK